MAAPGALPVGRNYIRISLDVIGGTMKLCWVTINVKNMDESINFYTKIVGLSVDRIMKPNPKMQIAFLGSGETKVRTTI